MASKTPTAIRPAPQQAPAPQRHLLRNIVLAILLIAGIVVGGLALTTNLFSGSAQVEPRQTEQVNTAPVEPPAQTEPEVVVPATTIPIVREPWKEIGFPGARVDGILINPDDGSLQIIQLPWRGEKGQVWITRDGNSLTYLGEKITPHNVQVAAVEENRSYWEDYFNEKLLLQLELNPEFIPPVTGKFQGGLAEMVIEGNILFAAILDVSTNAGERMPPARDVWRIVVSLDNGSSWIEIAPPRLVSISWMPSLAIGERHLWLQLKGVLWQLLLPTQSSP